jgi:hypothetical protein
MSKVRVCIREGRGKREEKDSQKGGLRTLRMGHIVAPRYLHGVISLVIKVMMIIFIRSECMVTSEIPHKCVVDGFRCKQY